MFAVGTLRLGLAAAALAVAATLPPSAPADDKAEAKDKKEDKMKLPPLDAPDWKPLTAGLEVWDVSEGTGTPVEKGAKVKIHYTGWTTDGQVFDSSRTRGKMAEFPLTSLIKGWQEGIPGMKPGGVRRLKIPADLGYGSQSKPKIPANSTLVFEIELAGELPDLKAQEWKPLGDGKTGIRVWDVKPGTGEVVPQGAKVTIHYTGWTTDGKVFDSTVQGDGEPVTFPLPDLIKGWQEAVPGMKVGGVRRMELPYQYAYGEAGSPPDIPRKATLIFEIEVKGVGEPKK